MNVAIFELFYHFRTGHNYSLRSRSRCSSVDVEGVPQVYAFVVRSLCFVTENGCGAFGRFVEVRFERGPRRCRETFRFPSGSRRHFGCCGRLSQNSFVSALQVRLIPRCINYV